jgi:hypothetical protein
MKHTIKLDLRSLRSLVLLSLLPALVTLFVISALERSPSVLAGPAKAEIVPYAIDMIASSGVVDESSFDTISLKGPFAELKSNAPTPSSVVLRYNLDLPDLSPGMYHYTWTVRFRDTGPADRVLIRLKQLNLKTGELSTVSTFNSDTYPPEMGYQTRKFSYEWHLNDDLVLYKEARLVRLAAGGKPGLAALQFEYDMLE